MGPIPSQNRNFSLPKSNNFPSQNETFSSQNGIFSSPKVGLFCAKISRFSRPKWALSTTKRRIFHSQMNPEPYNFMSHLFQLPEKDKNGFTSLEDIQVTDTCFVWRCIFSFLLFLFVSLNELKFVKSKHFTAFGYALYASSMKFKIQRI